MEETVLKNVMEEVKRKKKSNKIRLQEWEYRVLSVLEEWGILGLVQLEDRVLGPEREIRAKIRLFFNERAGKPYKQAWYRRLWRLEKAGHIKGYSWYEYGPGTHRAYALTWRGYAALIDAGKSQWIGFRRSWSPRILEKYATMNGVGLVLEQVLALRVRMRHKTALLSRFPGKSEPEIRRTTPDLWIEGKVSVPMMVEVRGRRWGEYREEWRAFQNIVGKPGILLYLAAGSWKDVILRRAKHDQIPFVYAGELDEFREKLGETVFTNCEGYFITLSRAINGDLSRYPSGAS